MKSTADALAQPAPHGDGPDAPPAAALRLVHVLTAAAFIVILNETIMSNAIPVMMRVFDIEASAAQWLSTAFLLTMAMTIPVTGWVLERFGTRGSLMLAMGLFCTGTALGLVAPGFGVLLVARVVQATGTAVMIPLLMTTLMTVIPERFRGQVMGSVTLAISVAPAVGPVLSGLILEYLGSWRWIFGLVLPVAVVIGVLGVRMLPRDAGAAAGVPDLRGLALAVVGFGSLVWGLSGIGEAARGDSDPLVPPWLAIPVGLVLVGVMAWWQLRRRRTGREPLLDVTAFGLRSFTAGVVVMTVAFGAFLGVMVVLPLLLQQVRGTSTLAAGLVLMPAGLLMGLLGPTVGRWYDARGARVLVVPGAALVTVGIGGLAAVVTTAPVWVLALLVGVVGLGLALLFTPLFTATLGDLPPELYSHGSAILSTMQQVGGAAGTAVMVSVLAWGTTFGGGVDLGRGGRYALYAAALFGLVTLVLTPMIRAGRPESATGGR